MGSLEERLREVMDAMNWGRQDLMRVTGQSSSVVSQWLGRGSKPIHTMGKIEAAVALERETGFLAAWIAKGIGPKRKPAAAELDAEEWRVAESQAPYSATPLSPQDLVAQLALLLDSLAPDQQPAAIQALAALVTAPDSAKARQAVLRALGARPVAA